MIGPGVVAVPVAGVWTAPDGPREVDAPAIADRPDLAAWTAALNTCLRRGLHGRFESQLLLGDAVAVLGGGGGWSQVVATGQPCSKDARGYPGWVRTAHLGSADTARPPTGPSAPPPQVVITAMSARLRTAPAGAPVLEAGYGTWLPVTGEPTAGALPVGVPSRENSLWIRQIDVDREPATDRPGLVAEARRFLGLPYLWGGTSSYGLDCSGLIYLVGRRFGIALPRDAHDQAAACEPVPLADVAPGDLYFFARPGQAIHHVGFVVEPGRLLDSPQTGGTVGEAPITAARQQMARSAGRIPI
ncbi:MAG: NlpC/P60 family protein [Mycobacteriales bacterium]